tara:strand:+ start:8794 stop:9030 length:237 start_codon:yes stop_codon:yes gene_type:complete
MNFTNTETPNLDIDCSNEDIKFYISLAINVGLLLITGISELMGASKCKSNGFVDGIKKSMSRIVENDIPDIEKNMFAN